MARPAGVLAARPAGGRAPWPLRQVVAQGLTRLRAGAVRAWVAWVTWVGVLALVALAAGLAASTAAAATPAPLQLRDDRGLVHRFAQPPQRIVSMLPSLTEGLFALGGGARVVGVDRYSNWPPQAATLPRLGGLDDAQIEAIAALKPDLVLASTASRPLERLEALGLTVVWLKSDSHADVRRSLGLLAQLLGRPEAGEQLWARIEQQLQAAAARVPPALRGQPAYFEIGGGPYAAGTSSFIGETLQRLGLGNIVPAALGPFPQLNPEFVLRARPAVILGARHEQAALKARPGWQALAAVREGRLCGFDSDTYEMLVRPGPRLGEAAGRVADCLQQLAGAGAAAGAGGATSAAGTAASSAPGSTRPMGSTTAAGSSSRSGALP